jgi:2-haloacid dehalogenase
MEESSSMKKLRYFAVMFDLLTALLDSWTLWAEVAGDEATAKRWRLKYLHLTYGQGAYRPYEELVALAAEETGLPRSYTDKLVENWKNIRPWAEVKEVLTELKKHVPLGVVTNCSQALGNQAADLCKVKFDVVVTSERAGFYKPDPAPYKLAIRELGIEPQKILYVSGSAFDIPGAMGLGMDVYWHNRVGMVKPEEVPEPMKTAAGLMPLKDLIWRAEGEERR